MRTQSSDRLRAAGAMLAAFCVAVGAASAGAADTPPMPDHLRAYGLALTGGANIAPEVQPVLAFIDGKVCGTGMTLLVQAGDGVPPGDAGKTAYTIDVLADGTGPAQRPGCGRPGSNVVFYLPVSGLITTQPVIFARGESRVDLALGIGLTNRLTMPLVASDGVP